MKRSGTHRPAGDYAQSACHTIRNEKMEKKRAEKKSKVYHVHFELLANEEHEEQFHQCEGFVSQCESLLEGIEGMVAAKHVNDEELLQPIDIRLREVRVLQHIEVLIEVVL
jgi:hypothetical protein